jgi:hypothetical protein
VLLHVLELALDALDLTREIATRAEAGFPNETGDQKTQQKPPDKGCLQSGVEQFHELDAIGFSFRRHGGAAGKDRFHRRAQASSLR